MLIMCTPRHTQEQLEAAVVDETFNTNVILAADLKVGAELEFELFHCIWLELYQKNPNT